jgi:hypothetical protein
LNFCIIKSTMIMIMGYIGHNKSQHHWYLEAILIVDGRGWRNQMLQNNI